MADPTRGYLVDLGATPTDSSSIGDRLEFQWQPSELKRSVAVKWAENEVPGFSHRRIQWVGGGARTWQFKLQFFLDDDDESWVEKRTRWLESFTLPEYDENGRLVAGPRHLFFVWGDMIGVEVILKGPLNITYSLFQPESKFPRMAEVDITLEEFVAKGQSFRTVRP